MLRVLASSQACRVQSQWSERTAQGSDRRGNEVDSVLRSQQHLGDPVDGACVAGLCPRERSVAAKVTTQFAPPRTRAVSATYQQELQPAASSWRSPSRRCHAARAAWASLLSSVTLAGPHQSACTDGRTVHRGPPRRPAAGCRRPRRRWLRQRLPAGCTLRRVSANDAQSTAALCLHVPSSAVRVMPFTHALASSSALATATAPPRIGEGATPREAACCPCSVCPRYAHAPRRSTTASTAANTGWTCCLYSASARRLAEAASTSTSSRCCAVNSVDRAPRRTLRLSKA